MKWDIFSGRKKEGEGSIRDSINGLIKTIERFAPRKYRKERESLYYNYQLLNAYLNPLFALLGVISRKQGVMGDREDFICEIFLNLKDFYDPKQRLSLAEAIQNKNLKRKLAQIFLIFYDKKDIPKGELETYLQNLTTNR